MLTAVVPSSAGLMRSTLRDTLRRLKGVRSRAGKNDETEQQLASTGDPFRDKNNEFIFGVKKVKELIHERNAGVRKSGNDHVAIEESNKIRRDIQKLSAILDEIKLMVDEAERLVAKENKKKKPKDSKVLLLTRQFKERDSQLKQCSDMLELVRKMDAERFEKKPNKKGVVEMEMGKTAKLREQLNLNTLRSRALRNQQAAAMAGGEGSEMTEQGRSLDDDPETREQMRVLHSQENEINRGLDRLKSNVGRLHELAQEIGTHLDMQNAMIDKAEESVDESTKKLKALNRRLNKILKAQSPMNTFLYVACATLVLGMVGLLLAQMDVI